MSVGPGGRVYAASLCAAEPSVFVMKNLPSPIREQLLEERPDWRREELPSAD